MSKLKQFRIVQARSPLGIIHFTLRSRIIGLNKRAEKIWGVRKSEIIHQNCNEYCPIRQSTAECRKCVARKALQDGKAHKSIKQYPDGQFFFLNSVPSKDDGGNIIGSVMMMEDLTVPVQLENDLIDARHLYKLTTGSIKEGVFILDENRNFITANRHSFQSLDMPLKTLRRLRFEDILDEQHRDLARTYFSKSLHGNPSRSFTASCTSTHGRTIQCIFKFFLIKNSSFGALLCTMRDITAVSKFKQESRFFKKITESGVDIVIALDREGNTVYASKGARKLEKCIKGDVAGVLQPYDHDVRNNQLSAVRFSEGDRRDPGFEIVLQTENGGRTKYMVNSIPVREEILHPISSIILGNEKPAGADGEKADTGKPSEISANGLWGARKNADLESRFEDPESVLEHAPAGIFTISPTGFVSANKALCEMMSVNPAELQNEGFFEYFDNVSKQKVRSCVQAILKAKAKEKEKELKLVCNLLKSDGSKAKILLNLSPISNGGGKGIIGSIVDISDMKTGESEAVRSREEEAIGDLTSIFVSEISHPLKRMFKAVKDLRQKVTTSEQQNSCQIVENGLESIARTVRRLFDIYHPKKQKKSLFFFNAVIKKAVVLSENHLERNGVEVRLHLSPYVQKALASPYQMLQLFLSMIARAAEAMPNGGRLTISSRRRLKKLTIEFVDTSMSLSGEESKKVFEVLPLGNNVSNSDVRVLLVKDIVKYHGGSVRINSLLGGGIRYIITLPIAV